MLHGTCLGRDCAGDEWPLNHVTRQSRRKLQVAKVGGSLLRWNKLGASLADWLAKGGANSISLIIVGGGIRADAIRELDRRESLTSEDAHWRAVEAMNNNLHDLFNLMTTHHQVKANLLTSFESVRSFIRISEDSLSIGCGFLDSLEFLVNVEPFADGTPLPHSWDVTSDSIAARWADVLGAELVLLKSIDAPRGYSLKQLSELGVVDRFFPVAAARNQAVRVVNLRTWPCG